MTTIVCIEIDADSTARLDIINSKIDSQVTISPEDVDTRWPFRAGYPRLLRPPVISLPINKAEKPISDVNFEDLKSHIDSILETHNIRRGSRFHKLVYRKQRYGTLSLPRVVVDCIYDKETSHSEMWAKAVINIYTATQSVVEGNIEVGVELFDWQYMSSAHLCAPPPVESKELLADWDLGHNYSEKILQLFEKPHEMFQAMTPIGRCSAGQREYEWSLVIFFDAVNAEDEAWYSIEDSIRSILPSHIDIEIQQMAGSLFCSSNESTQQSVEYDRPSWVSTLAERYKQDVALPGCEISPQGSSLVGTLGGYIITKDNETGKRTTYGVTNAHVAFGDREDFILSRAPAEEGIKMQSPSAATQIEDENRLGIPIFILQNGIKRLESIRSGTREHAASIKRRTRRAIEIKQKELAFYRAHLALIKKERCIGLVQNGRLGYADYSLGEPSYCKITQIIDVALIKMNCERPWERPLMESAYEPRIPKGTPYHSWEGDYLGSPNDAEQHIKVVAKLGKGFYRMGIVSEFRALIPVKPGSKQQEPVVKTQTVVRPPLYETVGATRDETVDLTRLEMSILDARDEAGSERESDLDMWDPATSPPIFCEPGDSGSFVMAAADWTYRGYTNRVAMPSSTSFSSYANVAAPMPFIVGLLWGHSQRGNVSWMVPFDAVRQEIESLTGEKMVWPEKRTEYLRELEEHRFEDITGGDNMHEDKMDLDNMFEYDTDEASVADT